MEHHLPQLADLCSAPMGLCHLDRARLDDPAARPLHIAISGPLRRVSALFAVCLRDELDDGGVAGAKRKGQPEGDGVDEVHVSVCAARFPGELFCSLFNVLFFVLLPSHGGVAGA